MLQVLVILQKYRKISELYSLYAKIHDEVFFYLKTHIWRKYSLSEVGFSPDFTISTYNYFVQLSFFLVLFFLFLFLAIRKAEARVHI